MPAETPVSLSLLDPTIIRSDQILRLNGHNGFHQIEDNSSVDTPKIMTIGGGSGSRPVVRGLIRLGLQGIVSVTDGTDSGGASGLMRDKSGGRKIAHSDGMRTLFALADPNINSEQLAVLEEMFSMRNKQDNTVIGYQICDSYYTEEKGFAVVKSKLEKLGLVFRGDVLLATPYSAHIGFHTSKENTYIGEHYFDELQYAQDEQVTDIFLVPGTVPTGKVEGDLEPYDPIPASESVIAAMEETTDTLLCPGTLYGSIYCNYLPKGVKTASEQSHTRTILVANHTVMPLEMRDPIPAALADISWKYTGKYPTTMMFPAMTKRRLETDHPEIDRRIAKQGEIYLGPEPDSAQIRDLEKNGVNIIFHDATDFKYKGDDIHSRHNEERLAPAIAQALRINAALRKQDQHMLQ